MPDCGKETSVMQTTVRKSKAKQYTFQIQSNKYGKEHH